MESNFEKKIWEIAQDDMGRIRDAFDRIRAIARCANNYFEDMMNKPSEVNNNVLYMFETIEALSESENENISVVVDKLLTISEEMRRMVCPF